MTDTTSFTRLRNRNFINLARLGWVLAVFLLVRDYIIHLPDLYQSRMKNFESARPMLDSIGVSLETYAGIVMALFIILAVSGFIAAVVVMMARSDNWMIILCTLSFCGATLTSTDSSPGIQFIAPISLIPLAFLFPDGRFIPRWTRWAALLLVVTGVLRVVLINLQLTGNSPFVILNIALASVAQYQRYKYYSTPVQRQQLKLVMVGTIQLVFAVILLNIMQVWVFVLPGSKTSLQLLLLLFSAAFTIVAGISMIIFVSRAMLRRGLYGADVALHSSIIYGGVTFILVVMFSAGFLAVHTLINALVGGQNQTLPAVIATAFVMVTFSPVRRGLQRFVDRRLFGLRVDLDAIQRRQAGKEIPAGFKGVFSGETIAGYNIGFLLGRGGMAEVYQATQSSLGRPVAIKVLSPEIAQQDEFRKRFEREAKAVATFRHPNIIGVFDFGEITLNGTKTCYIAMEYLDGRDLGDELKIREVLPIDEVVTIVADIAAALDYAHMQGIIHRDVKSSNIMLQRVTTTGSRRPYKAVLTDFGILKISNSTENRLTTTGLMGTADYVAPEQILSSKEVDNRADIYSLGVMTYEMLTGQMPFKGSIAHVIFAHLQQPPPDPRAIRPEIPDRIALAVLRAMTKNPDDRYQTAGEFAAALN